jgi:carbonic anhydrase
MVRNESEITRKQFLALAMATGLASCSSGRTGATRGAPAAASPNERTPQMTAELRDTMSPAEIYQAFKDGHDRFLSGNLRYRKLVLEIEEAAAGQHPYAVVLSCIDSRVPAETIFDKRMGDIFSTRIAGNVLNEDVLGGMEFATQFSGAKLIMVMGHTKCGAIQGAAAGVEFGNLTSLLARIKPAVDRTVSTYGGNPDPSDYTFVDTIAADNVALVREQIRERSPDLRRMEKEGRIGIVGTMYDLRSGRVTFYD